MKKNATILLLLVWWVVDAFAGGPVNYPWAFNPKGGMVNTEEKGYREEICLNGTWKFMPVYSTNIADFRLPGQFTWEQTPIKIPSPWNVNAFTDGRGGDFVAYPSYPKQWEKAQMGWMQKKIQVPADWNGKHAVLHFGAVMGKTQVYVNGKLAGENFELFLPFELDVTSFLKPGQENEILVGVAKASLFDDRGKYGRRTYVGGSMWGIEMAGIWQDVFLLASAPVYVSDVFVQPDPEKKVLAVELEISNTTAQKQIVNVDGEVRRWFSTAGRSVHEAPSESGALEKEASLNFATQKKVELPAGTSVKVRLEKSNVEGLEYWTPDTPNLYGLVVSVGDKKQTLDKKYQRFGWRIFRTEGNRLLLNGNPIQLKGDSWHFTGVPQMTRRYAWAWFNMLKNTNANAVRFHAQPYPSFYMDVADEMGICVLDETGIWSSDGGPKIDSEAYWESCVEHIRRLIKRDKNHPSVFGWSVCNETVPVAVNVFKAPEALVERQLQEINRWVKTVQDADPTRNWISGDGETDRPTDLPTVIGHYGGMDGMKHWANQGKPWGIGEQSMAYYGTPKQASVYNGDRAYESMQGRMEAIAKESYGLIKTQRELDASYCTVFNLAWYALKPLNLGMADTTRDSQPTDGIFFGFKEGAYGMQPERLGPYTTTLNPGYDDSLPLYEAWPMLDALRCAYATPILPCPVWPEGKPAPFKQKASAIDKVFVFASNGELQEQLEGLGVKVASNGIATSSSLIFVDAANFPKEKQQLALLQKNLSSGAKVVILHLNKETLDAVNALLPYPVKLGERKATSFLINKDATAMQGLSHADFYFSELLARDKSAMQYGMEGDFIYKATPVLNACNTEWQRWNYRAETSKTGDVYRSEREAKGPGVVIATLKEGNKDITLSTLDLSNIRLETQSLLNQLLTNIGVTISNENLMSMQALDANYKLHRALMYGPVEGENPIDAAKIKPELNMKSGKDVWKVATADNNGRFAIPSSRENRKQTAYLSFWIYSSRSLSDLLIEPDMPSLDMLIGTDKPISFWLNGKQVTVPAAVNGEVKVPNVFLEKGWNHLILKMDKRNEAASLEVRFHSTDNGFMKKMLSSVVK